jgi:hypothetical protein
MQADDDGTTCLFFVLAGGVLVVAAAVYQIMSWFMSAFSDPVHVAVEHFERVESLRVQEAVGLSYLPHVVVVVVVALFLYMCYTSVFSDDGFDFSGGAGAYSGCVACARGEGMQWHGVPSWLRSAVSMQGPHRHLHPLRAQLALICTCFGTTLYALLFMLAEVTCLTQRQPRWKVHPCRQGWWG